VPEGLAAGLPVIGTHQTGAAVEFIRPGRNGWLIPENDE
jgi:glycosyltransferase involved in cell wall biosynthesis